MVAVTERAKEALLERKRLADIRNPDVGLRLAYVPSGEVVLVPDGVRAGDQVVTHGGTTVLLVDAELSGGLLHGRTVDCRARGADRSCFVVRATVTVIPDSAPGDRRPRRANRRRGRPWPPPYGAGPSPATAA